MTHDEGSTPARTRHWQGFLSLTLSIVAFVACAALLLGTSVTLCAFSSGTDMQDAKVFIRSGPLYALGGILGLSLTWWLRRLIRGR